ncbi:MAG: hypothetical protein EA389_06020 [Ilumatobacter sp.]|nr:MAG: hypothetical protein EA389_06020 [Ilumatobacter sp.]
MDVDRMYEVRFKGRWSGPLAHALDDLDAREEAGDMVVVVRDHPALVALMNRVSELGLATEDVTRVGDVDSGPAG